MSSRKSLTRRGWLSAAASGVAGSALTGIPRARPRRPGQPAPGDRSGWFFNFTEAQDPVASRSLGGLIVLTGSDVDDIVAYLKLLGPNRMDK